LNTRKPLLRLNEAKFEVRLVGFLTPLAGSLVRDTRQKIFLTGYLIVSQTSLFRAAHSALSLKMYLDNLWLWKIFASGSADSYSTADHMKPFKMLIRIFTTKICANSRYTQGQKFLGNLSYCVPPFPSLYRTQVKF